MRMRVILLSSICVNFALGALYYYTLGLVESPLPQLSQVQPRHILSTNTPPPRVLLRKQFFSWDEIESDDYATYIANLRSIDCPEPTIRDIIVADVNQLYAQRRARETVAGDQKWWKSVPDMEAIQANIDKLKALDKERRALLARLLGPNWEAAPEAGYPPKMQVNLDGQVLSALSPETKQTVQEISARSQQRQEQYLEAQREAGKPADPVELARIRQKTREELARVLDPTQLEEFLLRYSNTADNMRGELAAFHATPDEFRQIFRIRDPIDQQIDLYYASDDPAIVKRRQGLKDQEDTAIRQALGAERYSMFQLAQDPAYLEAQSAAEKLGAPADKVLPVYQVNQLTVVEQLRIKNDPTLSSEEKDQALALVRQEKDRSIRLILGNKPQAGYTSKPVAAETSPPMPDGYPRPCR